MFLWLRTVSNCGPSHPYPLSTISKCQNCGCTLEIGALLPKIALISVKPPRISRCHENDDAWDTVVTEGAKLLSQGGDSTHFLTLVDEGWIPSKRDNLQIIMIKRTQLNINLLIPLDTLVFPVNKNDWCKTIKLRGIWYSYIQHLYLFTNHWSVSCSCYTLHTHTHTHTHTYIITIYIYTCVRISVCARWTESLLAPAVQYQLAYPLISNTVAFLWQVVCKFWFVQPRFYPIYKNKTQ